MKTIFIVDDNDANLFAAQSALAKHYNVFTLPSAAAMFKLIDKVTPDLILLDIIMPEITGFKAIEMLKEDDRYAHIPVIFMTGQTDLEKEAHGIMLGAADFVQKPFSEALLLRRIKSQIEIEDLIQQRTENLRQQIKQLQEKGSVS